MNGTPMDLGDRLPPAETLRRLELGLLALLVVILVIFWQLAGVTNEWIDSELLSRLVGGTIMGAFFGTPIVLGIVVLLASAVDGAGLGSIIAVAAALGTIYIVTISVWVLLNPPEGGGVYGGHIFSTLAAVILIGAVLIRRLVDRGSRQAWRYLHNAIAHRS